ncbi:unnamed protein product [Alopecurus aequalis]
MARIIFAVFLIAGVMLVLVVYILVFVWAIRRPWDNELVEAAGLTAGELAELPCQNFKATTPGTCAECAVCLEAFQAGDKCRVLPRCQHRFHALCVDSWLHNSRRCPVCRNEVPRSGNVASLVADEAATSEVVAERVNV